MLRTVPFTVAMIAAALAGCGRQQTVTPRGDGAAQLPPDPYGDPRVYGEDPFLGFPSIVDIDLPGPDSTSATDPAAGVWAIQIAACTTESDAIRLSGIAAAGTGLGSTVDREGSWWKVRLGGWATMEEASEALQSVRAGGYSDAWVVERNLDSP